MVKVNRRIAALAGLAGLGGIAALATPVLAHGVTGRNGSGYLDRLATALGIERSSLDTAIESARNQTLQARVDAGEITQEQADRIRENGGKGFRGHRGKHGRGRHGSKPALRGKMTELKEAVNAATATALGYDDVDALREAARGTFLFDLAAEKEVSIEQLEQVRRTAAQPILDGLVNDETITREQADAYLERIAQVSEPSAMQRAHAAAGMAMREALATQLGYDSVEELAEAVKGGTDLRARAAERNVTAEQLQTAQQEAVEAALDKLVNDETITREEAGAYLERLAWSRFGRRGRGRGGSSRTPSGPPLTGTTA